MQQGQQNDYADIDDGPKRRALRRQTARMGELKVLHSQLSTLIRNRDSIINTDGDLVHFTEDDVELGTMRKMMMMSSSSSLGDVATDSTRGNFFNESSTLVDNMIAEGEEEEEVEEKEMPETAPPPSNSIDPGVPIGSTTSSTMGTSALKKMKTNMLSTVMGHIWDADAADEPILPAKKPPRETTYRFLEKEEENRESGLLPKTSW